MKCFGRNRMSVHWSTGPAAASDVRSVVRSVFASPASVQLYSVLASEMAPQRLFVEGGVAAEVANVVPDPVVDGLHVRFQGLKTRSGFSCCRVLCEAVQKIGKFLT